MSSSVKAKETTKYDFEKERYIAGDKCVLVDLFYKGRLGPYPKSVDRLRAGLFLMKDYYYCSRGNLATCRYDGVPRSSGASAGDDSRSSAQYAQDRYFAAMKAVGKYKVYALHFLRDEKNVLQFIRENPIIDGRRICSYKAIYKALNDMLDLLSAYYKPEV